MRFSRTIAVARTAPAQSLSCCVYPLSFPQPAELGRESSGRQNRREQPDDRSRRGEESAGASFLRRDGTVWTTDKDAIAAALLSAEITARLGRDPGEVYDDLAREYGRPAFDRLDAPATPEQREALARITPGQIRFTELAGEKIEALITRAPGNGESIGGIKVTARNGWCAARPSGTENIYKIYAESFLGEGRLRSVLEEAQTIVNSVFAG